MSLVIGLFRYMENAENAVDLLTTTGYQPDQLSAIVPEDYRDRRIDREQDTDAAGLVLPAMAMGNADGSGMGTGSTTGGLGTSLAGAAPLALGGQGPVFFVGGLSARWGTQSHGDQTQAAGEHGRAGEDDLEGMLEQEGVAPELAYVYAEAVRRGLFLIACETDDMIGVRHLMNQANAVDTAALTSEWTHEGWTAYDSGSATTDYQG